MANVFRAVRQWQVGNLPLATPREKATHGLHEGLCFHSPLCKAPSILSSSHVRTRTWHTAAQPALSWAPLPVLQQQCSTWCLWKCTPSFGCLPSAGSTSNINHRQHLVSVQCSEQNFVNLFYCQCLNCRDRELLTAGASASGTSSTRNKYSIEKVRMSVSRANWQKVS